MSFHRLDIPRSGEILNGDTHLTCARDNSSFLIHDSLSLLIEREDNRNGIRYSIDNSRHKALH